MIVSISLDDGSMLIRQHTIIWTNDDKYQRCQYLIIGECRIRVCHPRGSYLDYYPGTLSLIQVTDIIYAPLIFNWVAEIWLHDKVPGEYSQ